MLPPADLGPGLTAADLEAVRLAGPRAPRQGALQIQAASRWSTSVCLTGEADFDALAAVVCEQLGFGGGALARGAAASVDPGSDVLSGNLACVGNEAAVSGCTFSPNTDGYDCANPDSEYAFYAHIACASGLGGRPGAARGPAGAAVPGRSRAGSGGHGPGGARVEDERRQRRRTRCLRAPTHIRPFRPRAGAANITGVRLEGPGAAAGEGVLEVQLDGGAWGPVCTPNGQEDTLRGLARVACRELGYGDGGAVRYRAAGFFGAGAAPPAIAVLAASGNETRLRDVAAQALPPDGGSCPSFGVACNGE